MSHYRPNGYTPSAGTCYMYYRGVPIRYYKNVIEMMFAKNFGADIVAKKYQALLYEKVKKNGNKIEAATFQ